jgi:hypothetical protein
LIERKSKSERFRNQHKDEKRDTKKKGSSTRRKKKKRKKKLEKASETRIHGGNGA